MAKVTNSELKERHIKINRRPSEGKEFANDQKGKKTCSFCGREKNYLQFYSNTSPMFSLDKRDPVCKECVRKTIIDEETGKIDYMELDRVLRILDRPYFKDVLESSYQQLLNSDKSISVDELESQGEKVLGYYFKNIQLRQNKNLRYLDSEKSNYIHPNSTLNITEKEKLLRKYADIKFGNPEDRVIELTYDYKDNGDEISEETLELFGSGYSKREYRLMEKKYNEMKSNYQIQTNIHKEALLTYVRFKVKEEIATSKGDVNEAKKWYDAAQDAADKAKLTPKQLSKADLQGGITNFSDIFTAVEEANERIPIFPEFKYRPNDAVDFIIWCYINYERNLNGLPEVEYKEIYKFYDEKKKEYLDMYGDPYGIFTNDPTLSNRPTVEKFITIPPEFREDK